MNAKAAENIFVITLTIVTIITSYYLAGLETAVIATVVSGVFFMLAYWR